MEWFKVVSLLAVMPVALAALPNGWKACSRSASDYNTCFKDAVTHAISTLLNGNKKIGVLPLEPLRITSIEIPKHKGPVEVSWSLHDIDLKGLKDLTLDFEHNDWKTLKAVGHIPALYATGDYKLDGQVMVLPIKGEGKCNLTFESLDMDIDIKWKESEKGGKKYYTMEKLIVNLRPKNVIINFENLFNGDKALGDNMNKFLNENWREIYEELRPPISQAISEVFTQIANRVLSQIPAEEIDLK